MADPGIRPAATLGVVGGGQLGSFFVRAARALGYATVVLEPDPHSPAGKSADVHLCAPYDDENALVEMTRRCAAVTVEFENPPPSALEEIEARTVLRPSARAVAIVRDRRAEKRFLRDSGLPVAPFAVVESGDSDVDVGFPALLKAAELGYDGKGQCRVADRSSLDTAWRSLGSVPCVLEQSLALETEVSVVLARGPDGSIRPFAVTENRHVDGILDLSVAPFGGALADRAVRLATEIVVRLDYVGVAGVEMFVVDGELVVNEVAPRPHNSGHWTIDGARTSQFEQQVRALCGLPLGDATMTAPAVAMVNLLGDRWAAGEPDWAAMTADDRARLHLYGKREARPGRKMGHLTVLADTRDEAIGLALELRERGTRKR